MNEKTAIITGVSGQDGSYLAEYLLSLGYKVIGVKRRTSLLNAHERINNFYNNPNFKLVYGNLSDASSIWSLINTYKPDEFYNLAAQSHVKVSFEVSEETLDVVGMGTLRILNAIKELSPQTKFYQASSSEMYGIAPCPQGGYTEDSPMMPASPYACAKLFAHNIVRNYRNSYGLFACSGILFNHECVEYNTPIIVKTKDNKVTVCRPVDLIPHKRKGQNVQTYEIHGFDIWDGKQWTKLKAITATKRKSSNKEHEVRLIQTRGGVVSTTNHHKLLLDSMEEIRSDQIIVGNKLAHGAYPQSNVKTVITKEMAELLGLLTADGYVSKDGKKIQFTNNDSQIRNRVIELWNSTFLGYCSEHVSYSGFDKNSIVMQMNLNGVKGIGAWLRNELYNSDDYKKVPDIILNSNEETKESFLKGYYLGDGLKSGNGLSFKTNSSILAQGLLLLYSTFNKTASVYVEEKNNAKYYLCNISGDFSNKGQHLRKDKQEVRKITENIICDDWVFDLETESQIFNAGVGTLVIHNSPRRGETFVTRKITLGAAQIKIDGLKKSERGSRILELGNLLSHRDWGYAPDYVKAMHLMLQQERPDDYVIATGQTVTVLDFLNEVFLLADLDMTKHVRTTHRLHRPEEVPYLLGNPSKAKEILGWKPETNWKQLAEIMWKSDWKHAQDEFWNMRNK